MSMQLNVQASACVKNYKMYLGAKCMLDENAGHFKSDPFLSVFIVELCSFLTL